MQLEINIYKRRDNFVLNCDVTLIDSHTGIFGQSGSGKSTLMNLIAGFSRPDQGSIKLDGEVLFDSEHRINLRPEQRRIGVVFQHGHLFPHLSVQGNIMYGHKRTANENRHINPEALIEALSISPLLNRNITRLSGGERQRVALARTLLSSPRLLLMDEPLNGLDERLKYRIILYLKRVFSTFNIPLLFSSHSIMEMRLMTQKVLVLERGTAAGLIQPESLARHSWASDKKGYINLLKLGPSSPSHDLYSYDWGKTRLILTEPADGQKNLFELDAREIILFKKHPEATSARNLLPCEVTQLYESGNRVRVELKCGSRKLIAQIVPESVRELEIEIGSDVVAAIKASVFRRIF